MSLSTQKATPCNRGSVSFMLQRLTSRSTPRIHENNRRDGRTLSACIVRVNMHALCPFVWSMKKLLVFKREFTAALKFNWLETD